MAKVLTSKDMALPDKKPEAEKIQEKPAAKVKGRFVFQVRCEHVPQEGKSNIAFAGPDGKTVQLELKDGVFKLPSKMPLGAARDFVRYLVSKGLEDESRFVPEGKGAAKAAPPDDEGKEKEPEAAPEKAEEEDKAQEPDTEPDTEPEKEPGPTPFELVHPDDTRANPINGKYVIKVGGKKVKLDVVDGRVETEDRNVVDALVEAGFRPTWGPEGEEEESEKA